MHSGPSHPLVTVRANAKERDGETQTCSPCTLQCWDHGKAFWREKGRQDCTFILIQTKGPTLNSFKAFLSLPLKFAPIGFPAVHRDAARGAHSLACPSQHPHTSTCLSYMYPARRLTQKCVTSHQSTAHVTLQHISAQTRCARQRCLHQSIQYAIEDWASGNQFYHPVSNAQDAVVQMVHTRSPSSRKQPYSTCRSAWLQAQIHFQMTCYEVH